MQLSLQLPAVHCRGEVLCAAGPHGTRGTGGGGGNAELLALERGREGRGEANRRGEGIGADREGLTKGVRG